MITTANLPSGTSVTIQIAEDRMTAYLTIGMPPSSKAKPTLSEILDEIKLSPIKVDIIEAEIFNALKHNIYEEKLVIAHGKTAVNGANGLVHYRYDCSSTLTAKINERDEMDYKDLGLVQNVTAGVVIAEITPPTDGEDGYDVCGNEFKSLPGSPPKFIVGKGTMLNAEETAIVAAIDGNLKWHKDHFVIEEILVIAEDVGAATGNVIFDGDIHVKGCVHEGYTVSSKKNIVIGGTITNATITADGNIEIKLGCVNSKLEAKGTIKAGFCENSKIKCGGDLISSCFVVCDIFCEGSAIAATGKGVVVGGTMTCLKGMVFNTVGSESYTKTKLTLGNGALLSEEKLELEVEEAKKSEEIGMLIQRIDTINAAKKNGPVSRQLEDTLATSIRTRFKLSNDLKTIRKRIAEIEASFLDNVNLFIEIRKTLWPGTQIRIGTLKRKIEDRSDRCRVSISGADIAVNPIAGRM